MPGDFNPIVSFTVLSKPASLLFMLMLYLHYAQFYFSLVFYDCCILFSIKIYLNIVLIQSQTLRRQEIKVLQLSGVRCCSLVVHNTVSSVGPKYVLEIRLSSGTCFRFTVIAGSSRSSGPWWSGWPTRMEGRKGELNVCLAPTSVENLCQF